MNEMLERVEDTSMEAHEHVMLSRRGFLRAAAATFVGLCTLEPLPRVDGGYLSPIGEFLSTREALATERFIITVVSITEVGVNVVDVSNNNAPVEGATVTITSRFNGKSVSGVTGEGFTDPVDKGKVILDIADLAERDEKGELSNDGRCAFNGSIEVIGPKPIRGRGGMRDFATGKVRVVGASGFLVGTHALDDMDVYPKELSFDEWDAHYSGFTFFRQSKNYADHTFKITLIGADANTTVLMKGDPRMPLEGLSPTSTTFDAGTACLTAEFKEQWLTIGSSYCPKHDVAKLRFEYTKGSKTYYSEIEFKTQEAPIQSILDKNPTIVPMFLSNENDTPFTYTLPTGCPKIFQNVSFSLLVPEFPVKVAFSPTTALAAVNLGGVVAKNDSGKEDDNEARNAPKEWFPKRFINECKRQKDILRRAFVDKNYGYDKHNKEMKKDISNTWSASVSAQVISMFDFKDTVTEKGGRQANRFNVSLTGCASFNIASSFTEQAFIAGFPVFVSFGIDFSAQVAMEVLVTKLLYFDTGDDARVANFSDVDWSFGDFEPIDVNLQLAFTLSVGAGVKGAACLAISGCVSINMYVCLLSVASLAKWENKPDPHCVLGCAFVGEIYLQIFCAKVSSTLWNLSAPGFFDNWKTNTALDEGLDDWIGHEPRFRLTQRDGSKRHSIMRGADGTLLEGSGSVEDMLLVTEGELENSVEFGATKTEPTLRDGLDVTPTLHRDTAARPVVQEDGSLTIELVPCEGVNTFTFDDVLSAGEDAVGEEPLAGGEDAAEEEPPAVDEVDEELADDGESIEDEGSDERQSAIDVVDETEADREQGADNVEGGASEHAEEAVADSDVFGVEGDMALVPAIEADVANAPEDDVNGHDTPVVSEGEDDDSAGDAVEEGKDQTEGEETEDGQDIEPQGDEELYEDPFFGLASPVVEEYAYEVVEGKTTFATCAPGGIQGIGPHGGISPDVDVVINNGVFSDPRQRVAVIGGIPYLFRVLTVRYPTEDGPALRTRLAAAAFDFGNKCWGTPKVLEYTSGVPEFSRIDVFDYDFDIVVKPEDTTWCKGAVAAVVLTGGTRPDGDQTSMYDVFASPVITLLFLDGSLNVVLSSVRTADSYLGTKQKHMVCCPHIVDRFAANGASGVLLFSFLHRSADTPEQLMTTAATVSFTLGYCIVQGSVLSMETHTATEVQLDSQALDMKMIPGSRIDGVMDNYVTLLVLCPGSYDVYAGCIPTAGGWKDFFVRHCVHGEDELPGIDGWSGHGSLLFSCYDDPDSQVGCLYEGTYDPQVEGATSLTRKRLDLEGYKGGAFTVSQSGTFIFFIDDRDGWVGDEIDPITGERTAVYDSIHRIKAAKYIGGKFCRDFAFCELTHPIDSLAPMTFTSDASTFICSQIMDADRSLAQMHYIAVPHSFVSEVTAFAAADDFVLAGEPCNFNVSVINHGNMVISGFDLELVDGDTQGVVSTAHVGEIKPESIVLTAESFDWTSSVDEDAIDEELFHLSEALEAGALVPGVSMCYQVSFDIPEDWAQQKTVMVRIVNAWADELRSFSNGVGDVPTVSFFHPGQEGTLFVAGAEVEADLVDPAEGWTSDKQDDPEPQPKPRSEPLPETDDPNLLSSLPGLAIAGLGSLMAGYSARRVAVAREDAEGGGASSL